MPTTLPTTVFLIDAELLLLLWLWLLLAPECCIIDAGEVPRGDNCDRIAADPYGELSVDDAIASALLLPMDGEDGALSGITGLRSNPTRLVRNAECVVGGMAAVVVDADEGGAGGGAKPPGDRGMRGANRRIASSNGERSDLRIEVRIDTGAGASGRDDANTLLLLLLLSSKLLVFIGVAADVVLALRVNVIGAVVAGNGRGGES
jgi:hypothetical protein